MGIPNHLTCLLRNLYAGQEATVRTGHGTTDWFQGKEYVKVVYCHLAYLTYMQSISYKMLGWMKHKLESRLNIWNFLVHVLLKLGLENFEHYFAMCVR